MKKILFPLIIILLAFVSFCLYKQWKKEISSVDIYSDEAQAVLGRGVVSFLRNPTNVALSWRLLPDDPKEVSFNIYRKEIGASDENYKWIARTDRTSYADRVALGKRYVYAVRSVHDGKEGEYSRESIALSSVEDKAALVFDIGQPYKQARVVTGDLNGDGEPEVVVAYSSHQNVDPDKEGGAWSKSEDTIKVAAFLSTGERLWTVELGWGIEAGLNYQPMVVWDLDSDGRAEVILKTNKSADPLDYSGERITVLDGMSGTIKKEAKWPTLKGLWTDYGNDSRNYLAIAHMNGRDPYIIIGRGQYKTQRIWALDKNLHHVWERTLGLDIHYPSGTWESLFRFWSRDDKVKRLWAVMTNKKGLKADQHRGSHRLPVADINDDGKEEIFWGERCIGERGEDLWTIEEKTPYPGHADFVFPASILPSNKGKQILYGREGGGKEKTGVFLADQNGKILWGHWGYNHVDRGWAGKIIADQEGMQCFGVDIEEKEWSKGGAEAIKPTGYLWGSGGNLLGNPPASWYRSFLVDWDGDGVREIVIEKDGEIQKYGGKVVGKISEGCRWGADLFGDHREEVVATTKKGKIHIFFNTEGPNNPPRVTPMADRQYKNDLSRTAMLDTVIPTEGGYIPRKGKR